MLKEFREFIMRGNVLDLAIGVIIGAAFSAIVTSLITDVITPLILAPTMEAAGVKKLEDWGIGKGDAVKIGKFLASVISFLLTAFVLFMVIKGVNKMKKKKEEAPTAESPKGPSQEELLMEIRDLLKQKNA